MTSGGRLAPSLALCSSPQSPPGDDDEYDREVEEYRGVSDFFNIREANANVDKGDWEFESFSDWATRSDGSDDDHAFMPSVKYGLTNDYFVELSVLPINIGDGDDQGNGYLGLEVFCQFLHETDSVPAAAAWARIRIPSGDESSGVDASLNFSLTRTLAPRFRAHMAGFIETANGERGGESEYRRPFQWSAGPGFDFEIDEKTMAVLNYLMRSSEEYGHHNQNILETGVSRELVPGQHLKAAVDVGLDGAGETPNLGAKLQWALELKR